MTAVVPESRFERLIQADKVHGSLYTDPSIFAEELQKIWFKTWVFVGHESEVPQPNDYVRKKLATQDVVMTRDKDGEVHLHTFGPGESHGREEGDACAEERALRDRFVNAIEGEDH